MSDERDQLHASVNAATTPDAKAEALNNLAKYYCLELFLDDEAWSLSNEALLLAQQTGNVLQEGNALVRIGTISLNRGEMTMALETFQRAYDLFASIENVERMAAALYSSGWAHLKQFNNSKAIDYLKEAIALYEKIDDKAGLASSYNILGSTYFELSELAPALEYLTMALSLNEDLNHKVDVAGNTSNIGRIYEQLSDFPRAMECYNKALSIAEEVGHRIYMANVLVNLGNVHSGQSEKALEYFFRALSIAEEINNKALLAISTLNIGNEYRIAGDYDRSYEYARRSLAVCEEIHDHINVAMNICNIGILYSRREFADYDFERAEEFLLKSLNMFEELESKVGQSDCHQFLAELYETQERWKEFAIHQKKYHALKFEQDNNEVKLQAARLEQQRQVAEHEREIAVLNASAEAKLSATRDVLHRVLPQSIAERIIAGEKYIADYYPSVSILFADIVGFTPIAAQMPAESVIAFLNFVFAQFDRIMKKHGCQKIKTMGDGYMAVCGAPLPCDDHAERLARAAVDMMNTIVLPESILLTLPKGSVFHLRIGLHTGSAFAGIIGEEGFVYDLYSDDVNLASRMESSGEAAKIHVSEAFMKHVTSRALSPSESIEEGLSWEDSHGIAFTFTDRGESDIKGKGTMRTYFLEQG